MAKKEITDLKKKGLLQDIKELKKGDAAKVAKAVALYRSEGKAREKRIEKEYKAYEKQPKKELKKISKRLDRDIGEKKNIDKSIMKIKRDPNLSEAKKIEKLEGLYAKRETYKADIKKDFKQELKLKAKKDARKAEKAFVKGLSKADTATSVGLERAKAFLESQERKRVISRRVMKKGQMTAKIKDFKAPSVLGDENRFFRGELNQEKRSLYFS